MRNRGQFSKPTPFNYQSHQSLQKFRKIPIEQRAEQITQDIFKVKVKGQQNSKLLVANNTGTSKQQQNKQLKKQIKLLQNELKRKILQNPLLSKIFKTKAPSNNQLSHIDLYLEFSKLRQQQQVLDRKLQQIEEDYNKKDKIYEMEILKLREQKQKREQDFINEIEKATQNFQKIEKEFNKKMNQKEKVFEQQTIERQSKIEEMNLMFQELKRKNHKLNKQNKEFQLKLNQYKKSEQQKMKSLRLQGQTLKQKLQNQKFQHIQQIEKIKLTQKSTIEKLKLEKKSLQQQLLDKKSQIEELDRFIQLQRQAIQAKKLKQKQNEEVKIKEINSKWNEQFHRYKEEKQREIKALIKQNQQHLERVMKEFQKKIQSLHQQAQLKQKKMQQLEKQLKLNQNTTYNLQENINQIKKQTQSQIQQLKNSNQQLLKQNHNLTQQNKDINKKIVQMELKLQKNIKQIQHLTFQKTQIHSKYQKGFVNTENQIKHYQLVIQQLQRKIYFLGNQNISLKKNIEEKVNVDHKAKQFNKVNEQIYQQKFKALGRIQQIKHKLQNYLLNNIVRADYSYFGSTFSNCTNSLNNYKSNSSLKSSYLIESIEQLTTLLDNFFQNYCSLRKTLQQLKKQKSQDEREIQSILNHFIDFEDLQQDLVQETINYINHRKEITKQCLSSDSNCIEQFLLEKKKDLSQSLIEKLIQLKIIKQYSSTNQDSLSYRQDKQNKTMIATKKSNFNSVNSKDQNLLNSYKNRPQHIKKSMKNFIQQEQLVELNQQLYDERQNYQSYNYDSLQSINKRNLFQNNQKLAIQRKNSFAKSKQGSRKSLIAPEEFNKKYRSRISTEPNCTDEDIQQQSTYEIMDQNINYGNFTRRPIVQKQSLNKQNNLPNKMSKEGLHNEKNRTEEKNMISKRYKQQMRQKFSMGKKTKKQGATAGLSKEDIEKKYFALR